MPDAFDPYYLWLGIPPEEQPPNHYRLLTIKLFENNPDVISGAADRQMSHVRSFQSGKHAAESQKVLNELSAARLCLLSASTKAAYDHALKTQLARQQAKAVPPPAGLAPAAKPLRVAQPVVAARPTAVPATPADPLGFDPLAESAAPRHRKSKRNTPQPALLTAIGGAALLAIVGLVWALAGGDGDEPVQPSTRQTANADRGPQMHDRDDVDNDTRYRTANPPPVDGPTAEKPKPEQAAADDVADHSTGSSTGDGGPTADGAESPDEMMHSVMPDETDDTDSESSRPSESAEIRVVPAETPVAKPGKPVARADKPGPRRSKAKAPQFLTELRPEEVRTYSGLLGYDVIVGGVVSPHGIGTHPTSNGSAHIAYSLAENYQIFSGSVGISDSAMGSTATALTFRIVGDGKECWKSRPLQKTGDLQEFDVSVANIRRLELFVDCPGYDGAAHAVWIEPKLTETGRSGPSSSELKHAAVGKWVDLLILAEPAKENLAAVWQRTPEGLRVERRETPLPIPMVVDGDYSLHVEFTRQSGRDTVVVILPIKSNRCMLALSGHDGAESGFELINGQELGQNPASLRPGTLENGHRYSLDVNVRQTGGQHTIETKLDGKPYVRWSGEITSLGLTRNWAINRPNVIALAGNDPTVFHVAKFKLLRGKATIDRDAGPANDSTTKATAAKK